MSKPRSTGVLSDLALAIWLLTAAIIYFRQFASSGLGALARLFGYR